MPRSLVFLLPLLGPRVGRSLRGRDRQRSGAAPSVPSNLRHFYLSVSLYNLSTVISHRTTPSKSSANLKSARASNNIKGESKDISHVECSVIVHVTCPPVGVGSK